MKNVLYILLMSVFFTSCEEVIDLDLPNKEVRLVIDGLITNERKQHVITISRTSQYEYKIDGFQQNFEEGSLVIVKDIKGSVDTLEEKFPGKYYTNPRITMGEIGNIYTLEIFTSDGEHWISEPQQMISVPEIDSLYFVRDKEDLYQGNSDSYRFMLYLDWHDPVNEKNYYLRNISYFWNNEWHTEITWNWILEDNYFNGKFIRKSLVQSSYGGTNFKIRLNQYSLTEEMFEFWKLVREQTFSSSSDRTNIAIPLYGNVYNKNDPGEYALGYFQVSAVSQKSVWVNE